MVIRLLLCHCRKDNAANKHYFGGSSSSFSHRLEHHRKPQIVKTGCGSPDGDKCTLSVVNPSILTAVNAPGRKNALYQWRSKRIKRQQPFMLTPLQQSVHHQPVSTEISEMLIYERVLTTTEINQVGNHLADKWGSHGRMFDCSFTGFLS